MPGVTIFQASNTPQSGNAPLTVSFTSTVSGTGSGAHWASSAWDFGDGNTSTLQNPTHTYTTGGTFNPTVLIYAANGLSSSPPYYVGTPGFQPVTVSNPAVANFTFTPGSPAVNSVVSFTDTSTGATSWNWNFGDGNTSTAQNPTHTYSSANTFNVTLSINSGASSISQPVTTHAVASFVANPVSGDIPLTVNFTDTSAGATSWHWDFGDGNTSTLQNPTHVFTTVNTFNVVLSINSGASTATHSVSTMQPPVAFFITNISRIQAGQKVTFTDMSFGDVASWKWNFGDGSIYSTLQNPTHTYTIPGQYLVSLTVTSTDGTKASIYYYGMSSDDLPEIGVTDVVNADNGITVLEAEPLGVKPRVALYCSKDGGMTFGNPKYASLGKIGQYYWRARWGPLGSSRDMVFKIVVSEPVNVTFLSGYIDTTEGTS